MFPISASATWGISGPDFLAGYALLCLAVAGWVAWRWNTAMGPRERGDELPDLGTYELALLGGGSQLAITSAATQLHRDEHLLLGAGRGLTTSRPIDADTDPIERAVFETVERDPGVRVEEMRARVADSEPLQALERELRASGLLLEDAQAKRLRRLWLAGIPLLALGLVRVAEGAENGAPVDFLLMALLAIVCATFWLARRRPHATRRGAESVRRWRASYDGLRENAPAGEGALAAALFGGAALWLAEPAVAAALGVPREETYLGNGGSSTSIGGCSAGGVGGCGGCGGCGG